MQIEICTVLATAVELQEMNWFLIDFKATLMSWQQTNININISLFLPDVFLQSQKPHITSIFQQPNISTGASK